eukprot:TRINITY_DN6774_c1_g1_i1.p1 TRINITY_DN6774_c1_g1~~TRINITY_DN6774_c1_g1_i1.p1  ORF type:complete len:516 (-),score=121.32 TRINITY_DN6774_c1_g1_i1:353-1732(-)
MENVPKQTVSLLIQNANRIEPRLILPALMRYENQVVNKKEKDPKNEEHHGITYLQYVVSAKKNKDPAIHNYLVYLYARHYEEGHLINFLKQRGTAFDLRFALSVCNEYGKRQASVLIYSKMEMYEEATELALQMGNLDLAKTIADMPGKDLSDDHHEDKQILSRNRELQKKLWLMIARHVVEKEKQIQKATAFLKDCTFLKIEDILPFFPDFIMIDDFKEEICASIKEYNRHLDELQQEMIEATESAELVKEDIKMIRDNYTIINAGQACKLCGYPLLTRPCYVFPCHHGFHSLCLEDEMKQHLNPTQLQLLTQLKEKINQIEKTQTTKSTRSGGGGGGGGGSSGGAGGGSSTGSGTTGLGAGSMLPNLSLSLDLPFLSNDSDTPPPVEEKVKDKEKERPLVFDEEQDIKEHIDQLIANECILCNQTMIDSIDVPFVDPLHTSSNNTWKLTPMLPGLKE